MDLTHFRMTIQRHIYTFSFLDVLVVPVLQLADGDNDCKYFYVVSLLGISSTCHIHILIYSRTHVLYVIYIYIYM